MEPPCPLQLGPCGPAAPLPCLGEQREEKQLFEKFWRGTFKAVATPRPESVIVASITAQRRLNNAAAAVAAANQTLKSDERKVEVVDARTTAERNGCTKQMFHKARRHSSHRRVRRSSFDEELSPRPPHRGKKKKKKKRKSERKRKRKRSPSYSLSPLRKKKKKKKNKKKKSSKKSKRHRYSSKKSKHSSSSLKHERRDERRSKKRSRHHTRRRRRHRRSESDSSSWRPSSERRHRLSKCVEQHETLQEDELHHSSLEWRPAAKSVCKTAPNYGPTLPASAISPSRPGDKLLQAKGTHGPHDYDSGNDTSSPPSTKTGVSQTSAAEDQRSRCRGPASPGKLKLTDRDDASDSGNSVTSYASPCRPPAEGGPANALFHGDAKRTTGSRVPRSDRTPRPPPHTGSRKRRRARSSSSRSRSHGRRHSGSGRGRSRSYSSDSSRYSGRYDRGHSPTSLSSCSRSPSRSADLRRRGSVASASSRDSHSRYSLDRSRTPSYKERDNKQRKKDGRKRQRRKSYSPMKKRRRDSPSHLEARRITSARKRPIPYFRPSPSSSSRSTSVSSWSSLFTRCHSPSSVGSVSRSRSRSHSFSSYRSYSRSSSWNSIFGTRSSRSRSRSLAPLKKRTRFRR